MDRVLTSITIAGNTIILFWNLVHKAANLEIVTSLKTGNISYERLRDSW